MALKTPRIPPLEHEEWGEAERALLQPIEEERGTVPNIYRTMARHPAMFTPRLSFGRYVQRGSTLPPRDREILINRIAWLTNAEYEWSAHTRIGRDNGLTDGEIQGIAEGPTAAVWQGFDAALLRAVDELYVDAFVSDATWDFLAQRYSTHQMMDLVMTVGGYHMLAMALNSFGVQLEEGAAGFPPASIWQERGQEIWQDQPRGGVPLRLDEPRIQPLAEAEWTAVEEELLGPILEERGFVPNVYATLARHPRMYRPWIAFARYILRQSSLPGREREILICRTAWRSSSEYQWSAHSRMGMENGLTGDEVLALAESSDTTSWGDVDAALIRAVDELIDEAFISDATWAALARTFDTHQMMDLVLTVGAYNMLAKALNSFGVELQDGATRFPG